MPPAQAALRVCPNSTGGREIPPALRRVPRHSQPSAACLKSPVLWQVSSCSLEPSPQGLQLLCLALKRNQVGPFRVLCGIQTGACLRHLQSARRQVIYQLHLEGHLLVFQRTAPGTTAPDQW